MPFRLTKANFEAFRKMNMSERMATTHDSMGVWLLSLMSPTQIAELFPRYYRDALPNISGFSKAMPTSMSIAKQQAIEEQLNNTASGAAGGANFDAGGWRKKWQGGMGRSIATNRNVTPPPTLSPEQAAAWNDLKKGPISIDDARMKMFKGLDEAKLASVGISKVAENGQTMLKYAAPKFGDEEVTNYIKNNAAGGNVKRNEALAYQAAISEGLSPNAARALVANMRGEGLHNPSAYNPDTNSRGEYVHHARGIVQWDPPRSERIRSQFGKYPNEMSVGEQTRAAIWEMKTFPGEFRGVWSTLNNPNASPEMMVDSLVRNYEKPAFPDRDVARRIGFLAGVNTDTITADYSEKGRQLAMERMISEAETRRTGDLAKFVTSDPMNATDLPRVIQNAGKLDNVDPRLVEIMNAAASHLPPGYHIMASSGFRPGDPRFHGRGMAADFYIIDPNGNKLDNRGDDPTGLYKTLAKHAYGEQQARYPELSGQLRWGGSFYIPGTTTRDIMHFDIGGGTAPHGRLTEFNPENMGSVEGTSYGRSQVANVTSSPNLAPPQPQSQAGQGQLKDYNQQTPIAATPSPAVKQTATQAPPQEAPKSQQAAQAQPAPEAPKQAPKPTAQVSAGNKFRFDKEAYLAEVGKKTMAYAPIVGPGRDYVWRETLKGLREAQDAGVLKYDEKSGNLNIKDMNDPKVQSILGDMKKHGLDKDVFLKREEEKKQAEAKKNEPTPKVETKSENKAPTPVKSNSLGGVNRVNTEQISAYPINGIKNDNVVVVNKQQKPLFTMNTNEGLMMDPSTKTASVTPVQRPSPLRPNNPNPMSAMLQEFNTGMDKLKEAFGTNDPGKSTDPTQPKEHFTADAYSGVALEQMNTNSANWYLSPSMQRASYRVGGMETGEPNNNFHYSHNNRS